MARTELNYRGLEEEGKVFLDAIMVKLPHLEKGLRMMAAL